MNKQNRNKPDSTFKTLNCCYAREENSKKIARCLYNPNKFDGPPCEHAISFADFKYCELRLKYSEQGEGF